MGKFEDYIKKKKSGENRTLEGSMLAFCKVAADEKDLPIKKLNKDGERLKLKEAREDAKNNDIVKVFKKVASSTTSLQKIKINFGILISNIGLRGNINQIDEEKFKILLDNYRTKHNVPNFFKAIRPLCDNSKEAKSFKKINENKSSKDNKPNERPPLFSRTEKTASFEQKTNNSTDKNNTPNKKRPSFKELRKLKNTNKTKDPKKPLIGKNRIFKKKEESVKLLINSFLNAVKTNSAQIETITKKLGKVKANSADEAMDIKDAIFEAVNICLESNNPTLAQNICSWFGIQSTTLENKIENYNKQKIINNTKKHSKETD